MVGDQGSPKTGSKPPSVKVFNCPSCGAGVVLRAVGQSVTAVCGSCSAIIDSSNENYQVIEKAAKATLRKPLISLGQRGSLKGVLWEVIGYVERVDGTGIYGWSEYLLYNPMRGFRWLTEFDGHWNYILTTKEKPTALPSWSRSGTRSGVKYLDKEYFLFHSGSAKVTYVIGEFYWRVRIGETVSVEDYINPPEILSCENSKDEVTWSLGEYIEPSTIREAFQVKESMPVQTGVAPNQLSTIADATSYSLKYWGLFLAVLFVIQVKTLFFSKGETAYSGEFSFSAMDSERLRVSPQFELKHGLANVEVTVASPVRNNWLEVQTDLVNDDDGSVYEFEQGLEFYSGYDDGPWSEGSQSAVTTVSSIPPGRYHLNVQISGPALPIQTPPATDISAVQTPVNAVMKTVNWPNGKPKSIEPMVNEKIEGIAKYYHENEHIQAEIPYLSGQKHGIYKIYRADGVVEREVSYKNGRLHGLLKSFDHAGNLDQVVNYENGDQVAGTLPPLNERFQEQLQLRIAVRRDVVTWSNFLWALLLISIYPIFTWWRSRSFEMSRWSQSDFSPYYSHRADAWELDLE